MRFLDRILRRELVTVDATSLASVNGTNTLSSQDVLSLRNDFQVRRIHADTIPTKMVDLHPLGDRTHEQFVDGSMCSMSLVLEREDTVPLARWLVRPFPAFPNLLCRCVFGPQPGLVFGHAQSIHEPCRLS